MTTSELTKETTSRDLRGLEVMMAHTGLPDMIIGDVAGTITLPALRRAARVLQARHPGLRARVVGASRKRPRFEYLPIDQVGVQVEEHVDFEPNAASRC